MTDPDRTGVPGFIPGSNAPGPISWVLADHDVDWLLEALIGASEVVVDLETTGLDEHATTGGVTNGGVSARIVLASFTLPQADADGDWNGEVPTTYVLPLSHPDSPFRGRWRRITRLWASTIRTHGKPVSNQNVKFDAKWIEAACGVDLSHLLVWDTQVSSHLLDETSSTRLKERAPATFGVPRWDDHDLTYPGAAEDVPLFDLGEYAARDTWWTWRLREEHRHLMWLSDRDGEQPETPDEVILARLGKVATWVAMPTVQSLTRIEQRGFRLDEAWVRAQLEEEQRTKATTMRRMVEKYGALPGTPSTAATSHWFKAWTAASVEAGDLVVAAMTEKGAWQWSKGVLNRQARTNPDGDAALVLEQRKATKRAEYLSSWLGFMAPDGKVHTTYRSGTVVTGRLSSADPNMQQVTKALKPAFIPSDGYVIADLDYSQVELRVAAFLSRSEPMIEAFRRGDDLHRMLAARVVKKDLADITPFERQAGKSANFGLLYGMGPYGFRIYAEDVYGVTLTEAEAVDFHHGFFDLWTGLREWHAKCIGRVHAHGQITSPIGRVRRLPGVFDANPKMVAYSERSAINSPVQGFASDLMQMAAASIQGLLPGTTSVPGVHVVGTVHDSIVLEVPVTGWDETVDACRDRMINLDRVLARMGVDFDVPLVADATVGTRWGWDDVSSPV